MARHSAGSLRKPEIYKKRRDGIPAGDTTPLRKFGKQAGGGSVYSPRSSTMQTPACIRLVAT